MDASSHLDVIAPLFSGSSDAADPVGSIVLKSDAGQFLYPLIQSWPTPSRSAEALLVRREEDSVVFLNELRHQTDAALKLRIPLSWEGVPAVMAALGKEGRKPPLPWNGKQADSAGHRIHPFRGQPGNLKITPKIIPGGDVPF